MRLLNCTLKDPLQCFDFATGINAFDEHLNFTNDRQYDGQSMPVCQFCLMYTLAKPSMFFERNCQQAQNLMIALSKAVHK